MKFRLILFLIFLIVSCAPQATPGPDTAVTSPPENDISTNEPNTNPFAPQPGDADLTRGNIYINESSLVIRESYPPQISLSISGDLPTRVTNYEQKSARQIRKTTSRWMYTR